MQTVSVGVSYEHGCFLNSPEEVRSSQRPLFFDMKSSYQVLSWRLIHVNQPIFPSQQQQHSAFLPISLTYSESLPSTDNTPHNR